MGQPARRMPAWLQLLGECILRTPSPQPPCAGPGAGRSGSPRMDEGPRLSMSFKVNRLPPHPLRPPRPRDIAAVRRRFPSVMPGPNQHKPHCTDSRRARAIVEAKERSLAVNPRGREPWTTRTPVDRITSRSPGIGNPPAARETCCGPFFRSRLSDFRRRLAGVLSVRTRGFARLFRASLRFRFAGREKEEPGRCSCSCRSLPFSARLWNRASLLGRRKRCRGSRHAQTRHRPHPQPHHYRAAFRRDRDEGLAEPASR